MLLQRKVYYDLVGLRDELKRDDVAILRLEQLYPLHDAEIASEPAAYPSKVPVVWVQEEPANMGGVAVFVCAIRRQTDGHPALLGWACRPAPRPAPRPELAC